jgi:molybdenum cofactor cytidylyltransferase
MKAETGFLKDYAVLILAAGFSGRMGIPKLSLPFDENRTFYDKIIQTYQSAGCENIVLVVNRQGEKFLKMQGLISAKNNVSIVLNTYPERERFYSLQTGLKSLRNEMPVFIQNIDNPFVKPELLWKIIEKLRPESFVAPRYNAHGGHPVLFSPEIVRDLAATSDWSQNLRAFLQAYPKINCPVTDENILVNINSPEEYEKYFGKLYLR